MAILEGVRHWCNPTNRSSTVTVPAGNTLLLPAENRRVSFDVAIAALPFGRLWVGQSDIGVPIGDELGFFISEVTDTIPFHADTGIWCSMIAEEIWINTVGPTDVTTSETFNAWPVFCGGLESCPYTVSRWRTIRFDGVDNSRQRVWSSDPRRIMLGWGRGNDIMRMFDRDGEGTGGQFQWTRGDNDAVLKYADLGPRMQSEIWVDQPLVAAGVGHFCEAVMFG